MRKKDFIVLVLGVVGMLFFSVGMCMALITEWNALKAGVVFGVIGALILLVTYFVYRKNSGKEPVKIDRKVVLKVLYVIFSVIVFGAGMSLTLLYEEHMLKGVIVGIVGIVLCLGMIPLFKGFKD